MYLFIFLLFHMTGLPGGTGTSAGVTAEKCGDGEQASEN